NRLTFSPLADELDFTKNYIFLQKIRFGDNLQIAVKGENVNRFVPPLAIQLLVENAIKHNVVSELHPLNVNLNIEDNYCTITNSIKEKLDKDSTGIGLNNLQARYLYLSNEPVEVKNSNGIFSVRLPLLKLEG
ncbi:MAG: histidine kinase, partial [Bacteroidota bacterium]